MNFEYVCMRERGEEKEGHEKTFLLTFCTICCLAINIELGIDNGRLRKITFKIFLYLLHFTLSLLRLHSESPGGKKPNKNIIPNGQTWRLVHLTVTTLLKLEMSQDCMLVFGGVLLSCK